MHYKLNYNLFYLLLSLLIFASFFLGFYLNEDAAGGGKGDLYDHEWGNIQLFVNSNISDALTDNMYESSRTPLYLIINKFNPFVKNIDDFRISYLIFALTIPVLFFTFLINKFKKANLSLLIFISSLLILSPYFRTMAFWADQEGLAIFFLLLSLIFLSYLNDLVYVEEIKKYYLFSILSAFCSFLAFYSDQKYIFLGLFIYSFLILKKNLVNFLIYSFVFLLFATPALYLFYVWNGLVPVQSQFRIVFSPFGFNIFLSSIGIYLMPILFVVIIEKKIKKIFSNFKSIDIIILLITGIVLLITLPTDPKFEGAGILFKILSLLSIKFNINWILTLSLYYFVNLFFLLLILLFLKKDLKNYIFLIVFSLIFVITNFTYQQYVDPLFFILIYCYFNFVDQINIVDRKYIFSYFLFYFIMLFGALLYRSSCYTYFIEAACGFK